MARWHVFEGKNAPQCTRCGMWAPFARYRRSTGVNARWLTNYCPECGAEMHSCDRCIGCKEADKDNNYWKENGICYACRENAWTEAELKGGANDRNSL